MEQTPILECRNLCISYDTRGGEIPAVIDFNLKVMPGQGVGIVGESGCGKSTVALAIMQYLGSNGYIKSGEIFSMAVICGLCRRRNSGLCGARRSP